MSRGLPVIRFAGGVVDLRREGEQRVPGLLSHRPHVLEHDDRSAALPLDDRLDPEEAGRDPLARVPTVRHPGDDGVDRGQLDGLPVAHAR